MTTTLSDRPIKCGICEKALDPATDVVTFLGVGKRDGGRGLFLALCASKMPDGEDSPCVKKGVFWATNNLKQQPTLLSYEEWRAKPVNRTVQATRTTKGRYDLHLTELHLNSFYFLDRTSSKNAEQAKKVIEEWKSQWGIPEGNLPDIDRMESDAQAKAAEPEAVAHVLDRLKHLERSSDKSNLPTELQREIDRHSKVHQEHSLNNVLTDGDDCESCRISRGIKKLFVVTHFGPLMGAALDMFKQVAQEPSLARLFGDGCTKQCKEIREVIYSTLNLDHKSEDHNEEAMRNNVEDVNLALAMIERHGLVTGRPDTAKGGMKPRSRKRKPK